ncbi:hypothetical protein EVAR_80862_1 [Eumeta japonica]|uniref:Uncharacterized protein n=1 Tax=Eumeta variegata TaxID=151549 RepID=A0A4C1V1C3_EUMVA|nr:hypothetical protein EVAR_80862_1 [Eumeta japonica]
MYSSQWSHASSTASTRARAAGRPVDFGPAIRPTIFVSAKHSSKLTADGPARTPPALPPALPPRGSRRLFCYRARSAGAMRRRTGARRRGRSCRARDT